jgi:hypothetical protein
MPAAGSSGGFGPASEDRLNEIVPGGGLVQGPVRMRIAEMRGEGPTLSPLYRLFHPGHARGAARREPHPARSAGKPAADERIACVKCRSVWRVRAADGYVDLFWPDRAQAVSGCVRCTGWDAAPAARATTEADREALARAAREWVVRAGRIWPGQEDRRRALTLGTDLLDAPWRQPAGAVTETVMAQTNWSRVEESWRLRDCQVLANVAYWLDARHADAVRGVWRATPERFPGQLPASLAGPLSTALRGVARQKVPAPLHTLAVVVRLVGLVYCASSRRHTLPDCPGARALIVPAFGPDVTVEQARFDF